MRSKASFFSPAVYRKNLTRFAPLWLAYLAVWIILLPLAILSRRGDLYFDSWDLYRYVANVVMIVPITMVYAILVAMAFHSWYYKSSSANTFAALPIRREAWFSTNLLSALTVGLVPNLIVALLSWAAAASLGLSGGAAVMSWLSICSLLFLFFYALAAFCAALVGQIIALPVLCLLFNFSAVVLNYVTVSILSTFVYGMNVHSHTTLAPLSPAFYLFSRQDMEIHYVEDGLGGVTNEITRITFLHWGYLLSLAMIAVVLLGVAFLLFQRRRMESAGDVIAVRPLRPVFKYCFAAGCALVLGALIAFLFFEGSGTPSVMIMLLCLLAGGLVGYFTAEILLKKTFRVFGREWIGFGVFAFCLTAAVQLMEFDATGFERRVPQLEDVEHVEIQTFSFGTGEIITLDDPAYITDVIALHQSIIQDKQNQEALSKTGIMGGDIDAAYLYLDYYLQDGTSIERVYHVYGSREQWRSPDCPARRLTDLLSDPEIATLANLPSFPIEGPQNIGQAGFCNALPKYGIDYADTQSEDVELTPEEAYELFFTCVLPDLREGKIGQPDFYSFDDSRLTQEYAASVDFSFDSRDGWPYTPGQWEWVHLTLMTGSRTAQYFIDRGYVLLTQAEIDAMEAAQ